MLLTGARGTGKSSLVKAVWQAFRADRLRLIEVEKVHLVDLPDIIEEAVRGRALRDLLPTTCRSRKVTTAPPGAELVLDGSIAATSSNVLIYATEPPPSGSRIHGREHGDNATARKCARPVASRKNNAVRTPGLWLTFYAMDQEAYLAAAQIWLAKLGLPAGMRQSV